MSSICFVKCSRINVVKRGVGGAQIGTHEIVMLPGTRSMELKQADPDLFQRQKPNHFFVIDDFFGNIEISI